MPPSLWNKLELYFRGICDPYGDRRRYDKYKEDRATAVHVTNKAVDTDYLVGDVLGKGAFGLVKEGVHRETLLKVALKFVGREGLSDKDERLIIMEAGILTGLVHGHVVEMRGFYKWDEAYCLALEHMAGGELCEDIIRRSFYSEACARRIILQVLDALAFLHRRGIVHRDVKPENLLLAKSGADHVKLADFGLATVLSPPMYKVVEPVGSPGYAAPELLRTMPYDGQVDVFSLGVISFVLLSGYLPFGGDNIQEVVKATLAGNPSFDNDQWSATTEEARAFVTSLLSSSPNERPTAENALFHPWMKANRMMLLSRSLSDRRSGRAKSLLEEFQAGQKQKLKSVVGAVVAANRLQKFLAIRHSQDETSNGARPTEETLKTVRESGETLGGDHLVAVAS